MPSHSQTLSAPLVSVIVPAFNCEKYISEALDSIIRQDYPAMEILVVDDGSTDSTPEILQSYADTVTILQQINSGSAVARNRGMQTANGKYVAFLDSDDIWLEGKLRSQVDFLEENSEYGAVFTDWVCWHPDNSGNFQRRRFEEEEPILKRSFSGWLFKDLVDDCIMWTGTVLIRREVYEKIGLFDRTLRRGQDYDYWLRIAEHFQAHKLDRVYAVYRMHDESITHKPKPINYQYRVLAAAISNHRQSSGNPQYLERRFVEGRLAKCCFTFAYQHYHAGSTWEALKSFLLSLRYNPANVKTWTYIVMCLAKMPVWLGLKIVGSNHAAQRG